MVLPHQVISNTSPTLKMLNAILKNKEKSAEYWYQHFNKTRINLARERVQNLISDSIVNS
jgi:hypothetical protein